MKNLFTILLFVSSLFALGQSTTITPGGTEPNITANSTTKGVVFPRMTTVQKNAITSPTIGTIVYDTNLNCLSLYNGTDWVCLNSPVSSTGPVFQNVQLTMNPSGNAPLSGTISVIASQPIKLSYTVKGQDGEDFTFSNNKISIDNDTTINLFALYPSFTNTVIVKISTNTGLVSEKTLYITTPVLPLDLPQANEIIVNQRNANVLTKFILCFPYRTMGVPNDGNKYFTVMLDTYGKIRGYFDNPSFRGAMLIPLLNGNYLAQFLTGFKEIDIMGNIIRNMPLQYQSHHDVNQLPNGDIIYLGQSGLNGSIEDKVYTIDFNTGIAKDSINLYDILDPARLQLPDGAANDWLHCNSLTYDKTDTSIIISARHQSAVFKVDLATKSLVWILSDSTNWNPTLTPFLLKPNSGDTNFEYQYGQHSAIQKPNDPNTLLIFDNGNDRSYPSPLLSQNNYTRVVEYKIDVPNKKVVQNFEFGKSYGSELFTPYISSVRYINNDRILVDFGGILKDINNVAVDLQLNARNQIRIFEIDRNQNVYFDISIKNPNNSDPLLKGFRSYRAFPFNFK
jgi:arylsulfate sulfotransferase